MTSTLSSGHAAALPPGLDLAPWRRELAATFRLAWPLALTQLAMIALNTTDVVMMGWLGPEQLAAGTLAINLYFPCNFFAIGLLAAVPAMLAQELGARRFRGVRRTVRQAFWVVLTVSLPIGVFLWFGEPVLLGLGQVPDGAAMASGYLRIVVWGLPAAYGYVVLRSFAAAHSRPRPALLVNLSGILVNGALDYGLMFGKFGLPHMGIEGAAVATVVVQAVMLAALGTYVLRDRRWRRYRLLVRWWRPDWQRYREIFRVGTPIGFTIIAETSLFAGSTFLIGTIGVAELAGHAVALQCISVIFMVPLGVAQAATIRVGLAAGGGDDGAIGRAGWSSILIGSGFMAVAVLLLLFSRDSLVALFLDPANPDNAAAARHASTYLLVAAAMMLADGGQVLALGCLRGLRDTNVPMLVAMPGYWIGGLGMAVLLGFNAGMGGVGVWIGIATGLGLVAAVLIGRFALRRRFVNRPRY
jgi:multidrug resistance protein, MATE family